MINLIKIRFLVKMKIKQNQKIVKLGVTAKISKFYKNIKKISKVKKIVLDQYKVAKRKDQQILFIHLIKVFYNLKRGQADLISRAKYEILTLIIFFL